MKRLITICAILGLMLSIAGQSWALTTTGWVEYPSNPVYAPGHKAYYPTILKEAGTYKMWYASSAGTKVVTSTDGANWGSASDCTGLTNANHPLVEKIGDIYRMWYWPGSLYSINDIRTATSNDGITWANDQAITQVGTSVIDNSSSGNWNRGSYGPADVIYNPSGSETIVEPTSEAFVWSNKFVMYYDGTTGGKEDLGLAVSNDGINWQGYNGGVAPILSGSGGVGDWDRTYVSRSTVFKENDDAYHMWFSGGDGRMDHGIGYAFSTDGISWTRDASNPIFHKSDGVAWRTDRTYSPAVIDDEMWFSGLDGAGVYTIGYAVPEPATIALLGLGGLLLRRKRR